MRRWFRGSLPGLLLMLLMSPAVAWNDYVVAACTGEATNPEVSRAACRAYIEGFLDGALVTDAAIVKSVTGSEAATSDYFARAYQTRVSAQRINLPPTSLAHFCLPEEESRAEVVEAIADGLLQRSVRGEQIPDLLYAILKHKYPCPGS